MPELGGFFAVSYVAEKVFAEALDNAWKLQWKNARGALSYTADTPFGQLTASGAVRLDTPTIALVGAANAARLHLPASARLDLRLDGHRVGGVFVETTGAVDLPVLVEQKFVWQMATLDLSQFRLTRETLRLTWFDGPFFDDTSDIFLSDESLAELTAELRRRAEPYLKFPLPTDRILAAELAATTAGGPGTVIITPQIKLGGVRVLDGWLAVGADDQGFDTTHGDPARIGAPPPLLPGRSNMILVLDSEIVRRYLKVNAKLALLTGLAARPNIHPEGDPDVICHDNSIEVLVAGSVDKPDPLPGSMSFSANITIKPIVSDWVYASVSPIIRVGVPLLLAVVGGMIDLFGGDVFAKLRRASRGSLAKLFAHSFGGEVPGMPGMGGGITVNQFVLTPDLIAIYLEARTSTRAEGPPTKLALVFEPNGSMNIRERHLQLGFREIWAPLLLGDPTYRLLYQIRRGSTGEIVSQGAAWSGTPEFGNIVDLWDPANYLETKFSAEVIVERPPGNELDRRTDEISIRDKFDRAHPYARFWKVHAWQGHELQNPRQHTVIRKSAVHKTAIRERCQFGDKLASSHFERTVEALDAIPAPENPAFTSNLCPYCFREP